MHCSASFLGDFEQFKQAACCGLHVVNAYEFIGGVQELTHLWIKLASVILQQEICPAAGDDVVRDAMFELCPVWLDQASQPRFPSEAQFWTVLECLGADLSVDLAEGIARQPVHLDIVLDSEFQ